ncbi:MULTISPECIES: hypothetical protein [unclassified Streptomyces]|uniref:hypothetical protein n=1 Tax=unclassified Streptomyces TaxID=2593676 RepID=UPI00165588D8|nr:hypothetical protein [Streptomyces sp. CB02980]MCB8900823.1 hypothetical protein [Streptomyces sp. CB02980]
MIEVRTGGLGARGLSREGQVWVMLWGSGSVGDTRSKTVSLYMQGMHGDRSLAKDAGGNPLTKSVTVSGIDIDNIAGSTGDEVTVGDLTDSEQYAGRLRQQITYKRHHRSRQPGQRPLVQADRQPTEVLRPHHRRLHPHRTDLHQHLPDRREEVAHHGRQHRLRRLWHGHQRGQPRRLVVRRRRNLHPHLVRTQRRHGGFVHF